MTRLVRTSLNELFDQSKPFGRLAAVHSLQAAGSTLITISLAGSLFFSISPDAAEGKVLLYLALTIAPFALVGPALSPLLDRGREARRASVAVATVGSALLCLLMAHDIHSLLLFPEAFGILVLAKLYLVARASLVPTMADVGDDFAVANARLAVLASLAGFAAFPLGVGALKIGPQWVLLLGSLVFLAAGVGAFRLPKPLTAHEAIDDVVDDHDPAAAPPPFFEPQAATTGGGIRAAIDNSRRRGAQLYPLSVRSAIFAMTIARGTVGFVEFFLAFALKREHAATWWYGLLLVASGAGSLLGSMVVPRLRRHMNEKRIIVLALAAIAIGSIAALLVRGLWAQAMLTFVVGVGPTAAKPALDSIVQRHVAQEQFGRAFGRLETRLQLSWVVASLFAVVIPFSLVWGDLAVAVAAGVAMVLYGSSRSKRPPVRRVPTVT